MKFFVCIRVREEEQLHGVCVCALNCARHFHYLCWLRRKNKFVKSCAVFCSVCVFVLCLPCLFTAWCVTQTSERENNSNRVRSSAPALSVVGWYRRTIRVRVFEWVSTLGSFFAVKNIPVPASSCKIVKQWNRIVNINLKLCVTITEKHQSS